jgi:6-phosphofructokinase 1
MLGTSNKANPFEYIPDGGTAEDSRDATEDCLRNIEDEELDCLFCIGGDGTLTIAHGLAERGVPVVGVPKTIDNDLYGTDVTFGFDTAVQIVADAVDRLHTTAMAHHRVMVVETMGRYAGWLALVGGMAGGGDIILIPEIDYSMDVVCEKVEERSNSGRRFSIVVVSEGVKKPGGDYVVRQRVEDSHEQVRLGGIGTWISSEIQEATGRESRAVVLGHIQRGGTPTARDRVLGTRFGREAMVQAAEGNFDMMVGLSGTEIVPNSLVGIADRQRLVDPQSQIVQTARSVGTCMGDE